MYSVCGKHHIRLTSLLELYFPQKIDKNDRENGINSRLYAHFLPYFFLVHTACLSQNSSTRKRNSTMTKYKLYAPSITKTSISRRERLDLSLNFASLSFQEK